MKKLTVFLATIVLSFSINNSAAALSKSKSSFETEVYKYLQPSEFIKLSFQDISRVTGIKNSLKNKLSIQLLKKKIRQDLKLNSSLKLRDYMQVNQQRSGFFKILSWVIAAILVLLLVVALIFSGARK